MCKDAGVAEPDGGCRRLLRATTPLSLPMKLSLSTARRRLAAPTWILGVLLWLASAHAADALGAAGATTIDRTNFVCKYPVAWHEGTEDADYKADSYFTLKSPNKANTYVQFSISDKAEDPQKLIDNLRSDFDGPAITTLSTSKLTEWGNHKGTGIYLKGKILDDFPGGIKLFVFNSDKHNVIVIEYYFASELKNLQADLDFISHNFTLKN